MTKQQTNISLLETAMSTVLCGARHGILPNAAIFGSCKVCSRGDNSMNTFVFPSDIDLSSRRGESRLSISMEPLSKLAIASYQTEKASTAFRSSDCGPRPDRFAISRRSRPSLVSGRADGRSRSRSEVLMLVLIVSWMEFVILCARTRGILKPILFAEFCRVRSGLVRQPFD